MAGEQGMTDPSTVAIALGTGLAAVVGWTLLLVRMLFAYARREERRTVLLSMPTIGLVASLGALASALAYARGQGWLIGIDPATLTLIASMGRGGLFMGALIALTVYHPRAEEP